MKKILSLLLAVLMTGGIMLLSACGNAANTVDTKAQTVATADGNTESGEPAETEPSFPDANYDGADFTVYMRSESAASYPGIYIYCEEESGDIVKDQVFRRNAQVSAKYGITIKTIEKSSPYSTVKNDVSGGTVDYDIILDQRSKMASLATGGMLVNVLELDTPIDFSNSWWDENAATEYTFHDRLYLMVNDVSVSNMAGAQFYYFNKQILTDNNLTSPYDYFDKNQWTFETFLSLINGVNNPYPEETLGVYGIVNKPSSDTATINVGIKLCEKDSSGALVCNIGENLDRLQQIIDVLKTGFDNNPHYISQDNAIKLDVDNSVSYANNYDHGRALFASGHFLFILGNMKVSNQFLDMTDPYGVIVAPKLNSDQERYYADMDSLSILWAIPSVKGLDTDRIVKVMDYWAYQSSKTVMPAYYDLTLKSQRSDDQKGSDMLDVIKASISYDLTQIYDLGKISEALSACYSSGSVGSYASMKSAITAIIRKLEISFR